MLKHRIYSALVLIPLIILSIMMLSTAQLQWGVAIVVALAMWEWLAMMNVVQVRQRLQWILLTFLLVISAITFSLNALLLSIGAILWTVVTYGIYLYRHKGLPEKLFVVFTQPQFGIISAITVLSLFWISIITLHQMEEGAYYILYALVVVWLSDTGGYFAGKRWGKTSLAKSISPNKTWQGVWGALALSITAAILFSLTEPGRILPMSGWLMITIVITIISIIGDLFESQFKRCYAVKDSGNMIPGHGGILDRIDSLIAAMPVFSLILLNV